jgi:hypothetical protein
MPKYFKPYQNLKLFSFNLFFNHILLDEWNSYARAHRLGARVLSLSLRLRLWGYSANLVSYFGRSSNLLCPLNIKPNIRFLRHHFIFSFQRGRTSLFGLSSTPKNIVGGFFPAGTPKPLLISLPPHTL